MWYRRGKATYIWEAYLCWCLPFGGNDPCAVAATPLHTYLYTYIHLSYIYSFISRHVLLLIIPIGIFCLLLSYCEWLILVGKWCPKFFTIPKLFPRSFQVFSKTFSAHSKSFSKPSFLLWSLLWLIIALFSTWQNTIDHLLYLATVKIVVKLGVVTISLGFLQILTYLQKSIELYTVWKYSLLY